MPFAFCGAGQLVMGSWSQACPIADCLGGARWRDGGARRLLWRRVRGPRLTISKATRLPKKYRKTLSFLTFSAETYKKCWVFLLFWIWGWIQKAGHENLHSETKLKVPVGKFCHYERCWKSNEKLRFSLLFLGNYWKALCFLYFLAYSALPDRRDRGQGHAPQPHPHNP